MNSFLTEDNGNKSSVRLMCFITLAAAVIFGICGAVTGGETAQELACTFLVVAFGGKVAQKPFEEKL